MDLEKEIASHRNLVNKLAALPSDPLPQTPVIFAKIKLLWQCNLACVYCHRPVAAAPMKREIVRNVLQELTGMGLRKIHFSGGEVFLHPHIFEILGDASAMGLQVNLTTNGTLLDRTGIRRLASSGVHSVSVSLDSADAALHDDIRGKKGSFMKTMKTIALLSSQQKPKVRVNTVVTSQNIKSLASIPFLLKDTGEGISWRLIPVCTRNKKLFLDEESLQYIRDTLDGLAIAVENPFTPGKRTSPCFIPWIHIFIEPSGFVYPCCMSRAKIRALGNIFKNDLGNIMDSKTSRSVRLSIASGHELMPCRQCSDFYRENRIISNMVKNHKKGEIS